jgi:sugar/nucleoside kinase (ribokinase family)
MPRYDYVSMGFYTYDCLGWPFTQVPPGGGTVFIDELTLAVSGAAGTAAIAAAKMGVKTLAVGGVGDDIMADWVLARLQHFGVDVDQVRWLQARPSYARRNQRFCRHT